MMIKTHLRKLKTKLIEPVEYRLILPEGDLLMNAYLGKPLSLRFTGNIECTQCHRKIKKSFQQGYCYPCYQALLSCNMCMLHPERCNFPKGTCDPNHWAHVNCGVNHIVYLANSSHVKIGITRESQVPTRWIDQGAATALPFIKVTNRYLAGITEVLFKELLSDRTNWRAMLKNEVDVVDLTNMREQVLKNISPKLNQLIEKEGSEHIQLIDEFNVFTIHYPVLNYPTKIKSFNFDKDPLVGGVLQGIKGQYLIFDTGVINIRKFGGYEIEVQTT